MDPSTKDKFLDMVNQGNPLTDWQILTDREKASSANPLNIIASLLRIKAKRPYDSSISSNAMASLLHIKSGSSTLRVAAPYSVACQHAIITKNLSPLGITCL